MKKIGHLEVGQSLKGLSTRMAKISENLFCDNVWWILYLLVSQFRIFLVHLSVQIESNQIVLKIENFIWFNLHSIWFDMSKNFQFDQEIQFDLDSIWQPWLLLLYRVDFILPLGVKDILANLVRYQQYMFKKRPVTDIFVENIVTEAV
jgi:hypothetical protein